MYKCVNFSIFNMFCNAQIKGCFSNIGWFPTEATIFHKTLRRNKIRKPFCDKDLGEAGPREGGMGYRSSCSAIPVRCYPCNMTMMAYIKSYSANNPLLHAIPKQKPAPKTQGNVPAQICLVCQLALCRGKSKGGFFFSLELGFTMNVDLHQEATLGPLSLLKTLAACQGSSNFAARRKPCWQLVRSQGVTWSPGGNNIFQNTQANSPMTGD